MHVAAMRIELRIRGAQSLKEKRNIVKALISHLVSTFGAAVAEVDDLDKWQKATLGVAVVSNQPGHADRVLHSVRRTVDERPDVELLRTAVSYLEEPE